MLVDTGTMKPSALVDAEMKPSILGNAGTMDEPSKLVDMGTKPSTLVDAGTNPSTLVDAGANPSTLVDAGTNPSTLVDAGTNPSTLVDAGTNPSTLVDAGTNPSTLVDAGTNPSTLVDAGTNPSTLVDAGTNPSTLVDAGTKPSTLVDSGTNPSTLVDAGTNPSTLVGAGTNPSTLVDAGTNPSTLVDTGVKLVDSRSKPSRLIDIETNTLNPGSKELVCVREMLADATCESENEEGGREALGVGIDLGGRNVADSVGVVTSNMGVADIEIMRKKSGCDVTLVGPTADERSKFNGDVAIVVPIGMGRVVESMKSGVSFGVEVGVGEGDRTRKLSIVCCVGDKSGVVKATVVVSGEDVSSVSMTTVDSSIISKGGGVEVNWDMDIRGVMTADGVSMSSDVMLVATVEGAMSSGREDPGSKSADVSIGMTASEVVVGSSITSDEERGVASGEEGMAGRGVTSGEEGMGIAKGGEGCSVIDTGASVNEVAGWSNSCVSILLLGNKKSSVASGMAEGVATGVAVGVATGVAVGVATGVAVGVATGVAVGVATGVAVGASTSKNSVCEVLKKPSVNDGVEVIDSSNCKVLMKRSVADCVGVVGMGVTMSLVSAVGVGVNCRVGVAKIKLASLPPRMEVSAEKIGKKVRILSSSGVVVEGWMGKESAVKWEVGGGNREGDKGVDRKLTLSWLDRKKLLDEDGVGEMKGGKETVAAVVADENGVTESEGSRTSFVVTISVGSGGRTGVVIGGGVSKVATVAAGWRGGRAEMKRGK